MAVLGGLSFRVQATEVAPISLAECTRLRSLPVVRIIVERDSVEAVLSQLEKAAGFRIVIAPHQSFVFPISFFATGSPWDVMDCLQATDTVTFTLERGIWVARSPNSRFLRTYALNRIQEARCAEVRQKITLLQAGDPTARVSSSPDQRSITVEASADFQFKVREYLRQVDSAVRANTPLMVAVNKPVSSGAAQFTLKDMPANTKVAQ